MCAIRLRNSPPSRWGEETCEGVELQHRSQAALSSWLASGLASSSMRYAQKPFCDFDHSHLVGFGSSSSPYPFRLLILRLIGEPPSLGGKLSTKRLRLAVVMRADSPIFTASSLPSRISS